jgi:hypothetical protein
MSMKQIFFLLLLAAVKPVCLQAQQYDCNFKNPVITINFGDDRNPRDFSLSQLKDYRRINGICPNDGEFAFTSFTRDCYMGNWLNFNKDHTPGSVNGRMIIVNAAYNPATFFSIALSDLKPNTQYELSAWFVNVCPGSQGCEPTPPQIRISTFAGNKLLSTIFTGVIPPQRSINWRRFAGNFTTPATASGIVVAMDDLTSGGCGNDFAMDDIEIRECKIIQPVPPPAPKPQPVAVIKPPVKKEEPKPVVKQETRTPAPIPKISTKEIKAEKKETVVKQNDAVKPVIKTVAQPVKIPDVIKERDNPVVKEIETTESEILVELYDNGEIDGDTVTIYHNNKMVVSHAGLSTKAVTVKIKVDKENPHHELVMVANNLGSIPPNTSLMVITTKQKRYEVFISSSEQKNAKVVIDLQGE